MSPIAFQKLYDMAALGIALTACLLPACSEEEDGATLGYNGEKTGNETGEQTGADTGTQPAVATGSGVSVTSSGNTTGSVSLTGGGGAGGAAPGPYMLPDDFIETEFGGYKLGATTSDDQGAGGASPEPGGCGTTIVGVVRDFKRGDEDGGHPDFETFTGNGEEGIVEDQLGSDRKPVYAEGDHMYTTTQQNFDQWYRNVDDVNHAYAVSLSFEPNADVLTFHSASFFPVDDVGFGNEGESHNYGFTTEVHTTFVYQGGETFTFTGDDDLWVFVNGKLAIDLGGLHPELSSTLDLDAEASRLDLEIGGMYSLDLFHAERHTAHSNFRVDTNLAFTNCGEIIDDVVK